MKKKLALLTFILAIPSIAQAGQWNLDASGHALGLYGYTDVSQRFEKKDSNNQGVGAANLNLSAEYEFNDDYRVSLNADLMAGVDQELEDYNQGQWGEEVYGIGDSPYGRLMLGQTFNVGYQFHQGAPSVGAIGVDNSDVVDFISNPNWKRNGKATRFATLNSTAINTDGVALKGTYITPEYYNTMLGFTYVPDAYNRRGLIAKEASYEDDSGYIGALYNHWEAASFEVRTSLAYAQFHEDDKEYSAGINISRGGWTVGGSYRKTNVDGNDSPLNLNPSDKMPDLYDNYREGQAWDVGVGYEIGPYQVALSYFESKADNTDNKDKIVVLSNQYQVNKYVDVYLAAAHVDFEGADSSIDDNNQGYTFVTGLGLNF